MLDVRLLRRPAKHPAIFATFADLPVRGSFVLINDHDPKHLREEFETNFLGSYGWDYLSREPRDWRIKITKLTSAPLPRVLMDSHSLNTDGADVSGAVWKLQMRERDLDSNVIVLPPRKIIESHVGPDIDVLVHVLAGEGQLITESGAVALSPGAIVWLPRRSQRGFLAGKRGLRYLTVHQRRQSLMLDTSRLAAPIN